MCAIVAHIIAMSHTLERENLIVCLDMGIASSSPQIPNARLGATLTRQAVIDAATRQYLAGQSLDMSALAAELGIGRSTLYRIVGNREDLLGTLLAQATERTFRRATTGTSAEGGLEYVVEVLDGFMHAVIGARPLRVLSEREPLLFMRLVLLPGQVEQTAGRLIGDLLATEVAAGRLELPLPPAVCGDAIVRMCDPHVYAHVLGRGEPEIDAALELIAALLGPGH
jgi:AcrR family transcriptional regulator